MSTSGPLADRRANRNTYTSPPYGAASAHVAFNVAARLIRDPTTATIPMKITTEATKNARTEIIVIHGIIGNIGTGYIVNHDTMPLEAEFTDVVRYNGA